MMPIVMPWSRSAKPKPSPELPVREPVEPLIGVQDGKVVMRVVFPEGTQTMVMKPDVARTIAVRLVQMADALDPVEPEPDAAPPVPGSGRTP